MALEAKTNKRETSEYQKKDDIGQFYDHIAYLQEQHPDEEFRKIIVGRLLKVSSKCHPPNDLYIVALEQFQELAQRVKRLYQAIQEASSGEPTEIVADRWLAVLGLAWPSCIDGLQSSLAQDLQKDVPELDLRE